MFHVVDKNGNPANKRSNKRKNVYYAESHAQSAATQFNNIRVFKDGAVRKLPGAPFRVEAL